jgi:predicted acylesterase/phospholipase RssA
MTGAPVRIALTISSGASLGAYEAGVTAGLLVALQRLNERDARAGRAPSVQVDAVGATSAGAMVGLLAVRCLLAGLDPVAVLHAGWVDNASLRRLTRGRIEAPLSMAAVHDDTVRLLEPRDRRGRPVHRVADAARQRRPVAYIVGLGNLQGLTYPIDAADGGPVHSGLSHADQARFTLRSDDDRSRYVQPSRSSPLDAVLASMSHPALFDPRVLDRRPDEERYRRAGVTDFPESGHFWYADGGALTPNPLGAAIAAAREADGAAWGGATGDVRRIHVLVDPHTATPRDDGRWTDPDRKPGWGDTLARLVTTLSVEALYTDLRGVGEVNARLHRLDQLADALAPHLGDGAVEALRGALGSPATEVRGELLRRALHAAGGVAGKAPVATEVVSPMRLVQPATGEPPSQRQERVPDLLAGDFVVRFGGFGGRAFRHSDFVLGWRSTRAWLPDALRRTGLPEDAVTAAVQAVDERSVRYGSLGRRGRAGLRDVPLCARLRMTGVLAHAGRSLLADVLRGRRDG